MRAHRDDLRINLKRLNALVLSDISFDFGNPGKLYWLIMNTPNSKTTKFHPVSSLMSLRELIIYTDGMIHGMALGAAVAAEKEEA
jgi:hypothetical protein